MAVYCLMNSTFRPQFLVSEEVWIRFCRISFYERREER